MDLLSLQSILLFIFSTLSLYIIFFSNSSPKPKTGFKFVYPILGVLPEFLQNRHRFLEWMTEVLTKSPNNTAIFWRPGIVHGVITANPTNVEFMLRKNFENHPKGQRFTEILSDFLGTGIFNSDGELWKMQRKTASYEFNTKSLRNFVLENVTVEIQNRLVPVLERASDTDGTLDLQDVLERFAFDNICKLAFNFDPACLGGDASVGGEFMRAFEEAAVLSSERFMSIYFFTWKLKRFLNIGSERRLRNSIAIVHKFADDIIASRMEEKATTNGDDLLSRFIGNQTPTSITFLRDIVISFILAGRDTTSSALTWFFWLLSVNPEVEHKIIKELQTLRTQNNKTISDPYTFDELREMHYLHASISEAMRLYPPVPVDTKACTKDNVLPDGTFIGKGWFITYDTYAMGRMESIWGKDCYEFQPERWIDENGFCKQESPFRYPVFHAGPRICLGKDMAYIQMKYIAATMLERYHIDVLNKDKCPEKILSLTLRIKGGLHVKVKDRRQTGESFE